MTVAELIAELKGLDQNSEIETAADNGVVDSYPITSIGRARYADHYIIS